jgi:outer membrane protein insertion porin family
MSEPTWRAGFSPREALASLPASGAGAPRGLKSALQNRRWVLLVAVLPALAQNRPVETPFVLESLQIAGNRQIRADRIIAASGLRTGTTLQHSDFEAARARLLSTGAFQSVGYEYKSTGKGRTYQATFDVVENELFPYRFEDLPAEDADLRAALRQAEPIFEDRIPGTAPVLARYAQAVERFLAARGVEDFQVGAKLNDEAPGGLSVLFRPAAPRANIAEVRFTGNAAVPTPLLLRRIDEVAIGIPYTEQTMRQRLDSSIRPLYEARGYVGVAFPKISTEKAEKVDGAVVTVAVEEGPVYKLGSVKFSGAPSGQASQIEKLAAFPKGGAVNFEEINAGLERVYKRLRTSGYLHAAGKVNREIHDENRTVDLAIVLDPGPRYVFGKLAIDGLDILSEPEIRRMWGPMEGKPFNPEFPDSFLGRVRDEKIFENLGKTRAETHIDEASKTVDVTLYFTGAAPPPDRRRF